MQQKRICNTTMTKRDLLINGYKIFFINISLSIIIISLIMLIFSNKELVIEYFIPLLFIIFAIIFPIIPALLLLYFIDLTIYNNNYRVEITNNMLIIQYFNISNEILLSNIVCIKKRRSFIINSIKLFCYYIFHYKEPCQLNNPFNNDNTYYIFLKKAIELENILFNTKYHGFLFIHPIVKKWFLKRKSMCDKIIINLSEEDFVFLKNKINHQK